MHHEQSQVQFEEERSWSPWISLAAGVAFSLSVPINFEAGDLANAAGGVVLGLAGIGSCIAILGARAARENFTRWLYENADSIRQGSATWEVNSISPETTLRIFDTAVSMLLVSFKFSSRWVVDGDPAIGRIKFTSIAASLLLGWWGIPFGPIYTAMSLYQNLRGGHVVTVDDMLTGIRAFQCS